MTVSGPHTFINRSAARFNRGRGLVNRGRGLASFPLGLGLGLALTMTLGTSGCLPTMAPARFPARSDTTEPGSLAGPFDGRVVDAQSARPLPGAVVWVSWRFCRGTKVCLPAGNETWSGETDADGRYQTPRLRSFPGLVHLEGVTLVVYKRGYLGYRSDRLFDAALPRRDFAQSRNDVRLDLYPDATTHAEHLAFLGGAGALREALRPEALQASLETGVTGTAAPLDATTLLSVEELRQVTGAKEEFSTERLGDRPRTARYDSVHFRSVGRGEEADAAFRVFLSDTDSEAEQMYEELASKLPNGRALDPAPVGLGARAATGRDGADDHVLFGLLVLDRVNRATLLFSCGGTLCPTEAEVQSMARKVVARMPRVGRGPLPPQPEVEKPVEEAPAPKPEEPAMKLRQPSLRQPGLGPQGPNQPGPSRQPGRAQ